MPRKKGKGRGRGRGRGNNEQQQQPVGQKPDTEPVSGTSSDEPHRPGPTEKKTVDDIPDQTLQHSALSKGQHQPRGNVQLPKEPKAAPVVQPSGLPLGNTEQLPIAAPSGASSSHQKTAKNTPEGIAQHDQKQGPSQEERVPIPSQVKNETPSRSSPVQSSPVPQKSVPLPEQTGRERQSVPKQAIGSSVAVDEKTTRLRQQVSQRPRRPDYGTKGRPIRLKANFFKLDFHKVEYMFHYDVTISPEKTPISECREIVNSAIRKYSREFDGRLPAFDGRSNLYSRNKLPAVNSEGLQLDVVLPGRDGGKDRHFKLALKYAAQVCVKDLLQFLDGEFKRGLPYDAVQALDIVLRQIPSLYYYPVGSSFFPPPDSTRHHDLGGGCEVWSGFYQSIRPSQWKTMLVNIDVSSKGFQKHQPVLELFYELNPRVRPNELADKRWQMDPRMKKEFLAAIKGLKIETSHIPGMKRNYVVMDMGKTASTHSFPLLDEGASSPRQMTVEKYFQEKYRFQLKYPHLPCLIVGQKKNYLPMEVCSMIPCHKRKLTDQQTAEMIKKTARPAPERQQTIAQWATELEKKSHNYLANEFGMSFNKEMVDVAGRVLPAPKVDLGGNGSTQPRNGAWDMRGKQFFKGANVHTWAMVCFADPRNCNQNVTQNFAKQMENVCRSEGMTMSGVPCNVQYARMGDNIHNLLSGLVLKYQDLQLILVVLPPQGNKEIYKEVKRVCDTILGIPTQCVQTKQFIPAKAQVCSNIAMKINAKLGGTNHIVNPSMMPPWFKEVIVFGADVTHPSPGESNIPSIAAVVASMDCHASRYAARVRAQRHISKEKAAQEIILDMAAMVKELLIEFYRQTKLKPKRILFYRDGVSEGQFDQVLLHEVRAVQQACLSLQKDYQPPITFIVVQKRHHARLFCADKNDGSGRAGNVPPGTTVDRGITHPFEFDFYLCSHQGIQGTSRPAHYHVLYDDNNFKADALQQLTYHLCHTYARCTRSVSMPSPAYYAHLVAFRGRHHLNGLAGAQDSRKSEDELMKEFCAAVDVDSKMKSGMYFA